MEPIKVDLSSVSTPEELFKLWSATHEEQGAKELDQSKNVRESTFPDLDCVKDKDGNTKVNDYEKKFYKSFCYDGFLTDRQEGKKTIFFICREANITDEKHIRNHELYPETLREENCPHDFYMRRMFSDWKKDHRIQEKSADRYVEWIRRRIVEYGGYDKVNLAYMNLNKRGGFGKCNMTRVRHYVSRYLNFIQKEIELISPDIIICGGTFDTVIDIMTCNQGELIKRLKKKELICRDFWHPSRGTHENAENIVDLARFVSESVSKSGLEA